MSLRSGSIPSLIQGVSQQPAALRLPTQLDLQENCYSSTVEGLIRRPPTEHIAKISDTTLSSALLFTLNRDLLNRFNIVFTNSEIKVFTVGGVERTVNYFDETLTLLFEKVAIVNGDAFQIAKAPGETAVDFVVSGITTATVKLQGSPDGIGSWTDLDTRTTNGTSVGVAFTTNLFLRAIVSAYTSGKITAKVVYKNLRYIQATNSKSQLKAVAVADFTFLVNTTKTTAMKPELSTKRNPEGLIFVKQGFHATKYEVFIDGTLRATFTTSATDVTTLKTDTIATDLYNDLVAAGFNTGNWTTVRFESVIHITNVAGTDFVLQVGDSQGGSALKVIKDSVQKFTDLPAVAPDGFVVAIDANADTLAGAYYVKSVNHQAGETFGETTWQETVKGGLKFQIDPETMPYTLIRKTDGSFDFKSVVWDNRLAGDDETNSEPSFIGSTINDLYLYKNRLGFVADENFLLSETGSFFNFFRTTVTQLLDTDPIDFRATHTKVSILKQAVPFNTDLILFSDQTQFKIPGDVAMTPKTVRCDPVSEFEGNLLTKPVNSGKSIYFIFNREGFAGLKDLFEIDTTLGKLDAADLTAHVPSYVLTGVFRMVVSTLEDVTCLLTDGDPTAVYVYKAAYSPGENKKLQSSWSRWSLGPVGTIVLDAAFIESTLFLLVQRGGKVFQEKLLLAPSRVDPGQTFVVHLDRRFDQTLAGVSRVYSSGPNTTLISGMPYDATSDTVVTKKDGNQAQVVSFATNTITVTGDFSVDAIWVGQRYLSKARPSHIFIRKQTPTGGTIIDEVSILQLLRGYMNYSNSGFFKISVTPEGRPTSDSIFTGRLVGDINNVLGVVALSSGRFSFAILSKNDKVIIEISSNEILPFRITSFEWEGNYYKRSGG